MKLNTDCIRDVMLKVESLDYGKCPNFENLCEMLPMYSPEELNYTCLKLKEARYIDIISSPCDFGMREEVLNIKEITFYGHQFLEDIKSDTTWNKTKEIANKVGSFSVHTLMEIAKCVVLETIKSKI